MLEIAVAAIALVWLMMLVGIAFFYVKIGKEEREMSRIRAKLDFHEETIKKIAGFFIAIRGEQSRV